MANVNSRDVVEIMFPETIVTRILRVEPTKWNVFPALRMEVLGYNRTGNDVFAYFDI